MRTTPLTLLALLCLYAPLARAEQDGNAFFESKVRPILVQRCYECHSAEKKIKGNLRLDLREGWVKGGDVGPSIIPGKPEESPLIEAINYKNRDLQMPPKQKLSDGEMATLNEWVKLGAPDPRTGAAAETKKSMALSLEEGRNFWCYKPIVKPAIPAVQNEQWCRNEIDRFVLAKIEAAKLAPAPDAASGALARRLYQNLTGLPPAPDQIEVFSARMATDPKAAVADLADALLGSPQFGETWGRHWLDVSRFAESSGGGRTLLFKDAWRFRDYVIEAFNADLPFDRFIQEQVAGDLMPSDSSKKNRNRIAATAFLALGPTNYEEQDKQQLRFDIIDEQMDTLGRAFLGQTVGCARCHDHKFDPISQRDYYAMAGIFASTKTIDSYTSNVTKWIAKPLPAKDDGETTLRQHEAKVASLESEILAARKVYANLSKGLSVPTLKPGKAIAASELPGIIMDDTEARVVGDWKRSRSISTFIGEGYLSDNDLGKGEKSVTFMPAIAKTARYELRLAYTFAPDRASHVRVNILHADGEETLYIDQTAVPAVDGRFVSLGTYRFEKDGAGYILIGNDETKGFVTVDALQLLPEELPDDEKTTTPGATAGPAPSAEVLAAAKRVKQLEKDLAKLNKSGVVRDTAMAVLDDPAQFGDASIRVRGIEKQRGDSVPRGFLSIALARDAKPAIPEKASGRLELAQWIASGQNPLTGRVYVNRVWSWLFGQGIVRTVDLFSTTGEKPSHPELLDYLASRFVEEGWSTKRLIREIVGSRTWQQAVAQPSQADPENLLFAHANRRRLDADQIRDAMLSISGSIDLAVGGPNIAGAGEIDPNNFSAQNVEYAYVYSDTRRSVYTPAFRNKRLELFDVFDFGDANQSTGQRHVSTVAPQALYMMNHPFVMEQAKLAAARFAVGGDPVETRLNSIFQCTLGREPSAAEKQSCLRLLEAAPASPEAWTRVQQALFGTLDFRYLE